MRYRLAGILLSILGVTCPLYSQASTQPRIDYGNTPLRISAWLSDARSVIGYLRLTSLEGNVERFVVLPSDLKHQGDEETILRQQIKIIGELSLSAGIPKDFEVQVTNISRPGTYEGDLKLFLPNQELADAITIPITVTAKVRPTLTPLPGTDQVQLRLVNCGDGLGIDCALAHFMLPASAYKDRWVLSFSNLNQAPVLFVDGQIFLKGEQTGYQLTKEEVTLLSIQQALQTNQIVTFPIKINRVVIPPDNYKGTIYLSMSDQPQPLVIPIDLKMRSGPFVPVVLLVVGILLGQLIKYMQEGRGGKIVAVQQKMYELATRITGEAQAGDQDALNVIVYRARASLQLAKLDQVESQQKLIESCLEALSTVYRMRRRIKEEVQVYDQEALNGMVEQVRRSINRGELGRVARDQEAIESRIVGLARLSELEERLPSLEDVRIKGTNLEEQLKQILGNINSTRRLLKIGIDENIKEKVDNNIEAIINDLSNFQQGTLMGAGQKPAESDLLKIAKEVQKDLEILVKPEEESLLVASENTDQVSLPKEQSSRDWLKNFFTFLYVCYGKIRVGGTFWILQPLVKIALLIGASAVGIHSIYIKNGDTFGANPFSDYTGLILWGLGADIVSRTLSASQKSKEESVNGAQLSKSK